MNNTFFGISKELSIIALSIVAMLFSVISGYGVINNMISFLFVVMKTLIFIAVPFMIYVFEKNDSEFKKVAGVYTSYFIINFFVTMIASVFMVNGETILICQILFDLVNMIILLTGLLILIEQILCLSKIKNKVYSNTVMKIVYSVSNFVSYPFLVFINKKVNKDNY